MDENPPKIEEPVPVAPLENPASQSEAKGAPAPVTEEIVQPTIEAAAPVVAAAA